jgi:Zn-dependent M28 family amino/carboxypeptidase
VVLPFVHCGFAVAAGTSGCVPPQFDADAAFSHLIAQLGHGPRTPESPGIAQTRKHIFTTLGACGFSTSTQPFTAIAPVIGRMIHAENIIGVHPPGFRARFVLSAHYDTRPVADMDPDPSRRGMPIPGANDGASGVAVLLELARIFGACPPPSSVALVFFDAEDLGTNREPTGFCLGSSHMAANLPPALEEFEAGINLDMVGDRNLVLPMEAISLAHAPELTQALWGIGSRLHPEVFVKRQGPSVYDDHVPFLEKRKKFIDVIDFDYPSWHTTEDSADKCSPRSLKAVGDAILQFMYQ